MTSIYKDIFGENKNFECSYYSGLLICPSGKILQYVHMGYSSLYENYDLIELKDGVKVKSKKLTAQEFMDYKTDYFRYYKKTEEYQQKAKEFKEMTADVDKKLDLSISGNSKKKKKENKYLKEKEAAYKADKEVEFFMFMFLNDYMKTIEIPVN